MKKWPLRCEICSQAKSFDMRAVCAAILISTLALPAWANARVTLLLDAMQIREVLAILRDEGMVYGADLDQDMLDGRGGPFWLAQLERIYDLQQMEETIRRAFETGMTDEEISAALAFFTTDAGAQIIALETSARRAISDPLVEAEAMDAYARMAETETVLMQQVHEYIAVNDLLEWNVSGAMSASYQFYKGLSDGGYHRRSEQDILDEVWSQQDDIRSDTESWLGAYLTMAYQPLTRDVLDEYIAYAASSEGSALNAALFDGFDTMYRTIYYALGLAVAESLQVSEL